MDNIAKDLFERNPKTTTLYKIKGKRIYFSAKEGAEQHAHSSGEELVVLSRADFFPTETDEAAPYPEGEPSAAWTKEQLVAYGQDKYPALKLQVSWKEDTILAKLEEAKNAK